MSVSAPRVDAHVLTKKSLARNAVSIHPARYTPTKYRNVDHALNR